MTTFDLAVLAVIVLSGLFAFMRGFVRSVLNIAAWFGAAATAAAFGPRAKPLVEGWLPSPDLVEPAAYMIAFIGSLVVFLLIARILGGAVRSSAIGGIDRTLGLLFGLARGALLVVLGYIVAGMVVPIDHWPEQVLTSRSIPLVYQGAAWLAKFVPQEYQPSIPVRAPPTRQASPNGLLSASPEGRAVDPPTRR